MINQAEQTILDQAAAILEREIFGQQFTSPQAVTRFLQFKIATLEHEVFAVLFLNNQHSMIDFEIMFRGTVDSASVYPREVAKAALNKNASAVIFAHNHPSDTSAPSMADKQITERLSKALSLLEIRVLDHIIVARTSTTSFAELGLL